ncbi:MAG TPA: DNA-directed RNA polymerase subunit B [archaeon]|nr:DNA-directed RNA polymerase subunit B [archaeon]
MSFTESQLWSLMESFFREKGLVQQHLDSFNKFIELGLQEIIDEVGEIPIEIPEYPYKIKFGKIEVDRPRTIEIDGSPHPIYPMEARLRNLTYAAPMLLEVAEVRDGKEGPFESIYIGDIPIMVKSAHCLLSGLSPEELVEKGEDPKDPGGYFVINGSERVIVALEDLAPNRFLIDIDDSGTTPIYRAKVFSTTAGFRARIELRIKSDGALYVSMPGVPTEIPFIIIMRALGLKSDKEIAEAVSPNEEVQNLLDSSFEKAVGVTTVKEAILYLGNRVAHGQIEEYRVKKAETVLDKNYMPHIGRTPDKRVEKALFLGEMAARIFELKLGRRESDDKDHYANKRLKLAGALLSDLFRIAFRGLCRDVKYQMERMSLKWHETGMISAAVRPGIITERIQHALATGNWGRGKVGVTQLLDRTNFTSTLSHLRRLQSPLSRSQPNFEARDLHPTHWGRLCPNETPEGSNCGLVKNLSLMANISISINPEEVKQILYKIGTVKIEDADAALRSTGAKVFIEGNLAGYSKDPKGLLDELRNMRRSGNLSPEINGAYHIAGLEGAREEVYINCDIGRVRRPLIIVDKGIPRLKSEHISKIQMNELRWEDLVRQGIIEYLDADEEENAYVALDLNQLTPEHTHLEIAPYTILGICGSIIPYAEYNQSPRNSYEAAMAKQALGVYSTNYFNRVDSRSHILNYPQAPIVQTKPMSTIGYADRPSGQNCVVAVLSYRGYNMEDALIFNKSSIERGLGRSTFYRVYEAECRQYLGGQKDTFELPESGTRGYRGDQFYRLLEEDGIVNVEANVTGSDVLIGRTSPPRFLEEYKEFEVKGPTRRDTSISVRPAEVGTVDSVLVSQTAQGSKLVKVRVRDQRIPELGDKFASRHGQKGVIGFLVSHEDMPFTEDGVIPDVIVNPHAIPSRMTIGHFVESVAGKVAALQGQILDGTPFSGMKQTDIRKVLLSLGFQHGGRETLYDGVSGHKYKVDIFIGVVYYQKLHHMVADKMHARARGQVQMLTRQPTEGRARGGGLRFGEMERDCLIGHGAAMLLKDRLLEESDKAVVYVCERCGYVAYFDLKQRKYICKMCGDEAVISPVAMSYAFKLLLQELMSLCIVPRLKLKERA